MIINTCKTQKSIEFSEKSDELTNKSLIERKFVIYPQIFETTLHKTINLSIAIDVIKHRHEVFQSEYKHKIELPVIYFSVTGFNGRKKNSNVINHTGFIIIDIDKKDNPNTDFKDLKTNLKQDNHTYACFSSPSGGLKLVFLTDIKDKSHHSAYFYAIVDYLINKYPEIKEIDCSGRNIARACFMPHDSDAYLNIHGSVFKLDEKQLEKITTEIKSKKKVNQHFEDHITLEDITDEIHYQNIKNLFMARTGLQLIDDTGEGTDVPPIKKFDNRVTDVPSPLTDVPTPMTDVPSIENGYNLKKDNDTEVTNVRIYDILYNKYRYKVIEDIMSTSVTFFDLLYKIHSNPYHTIGNPYRLDFTTRIDEQYFSGNKQQPLSVDNHPDLELIEFCEISLTKIPMGKRGKKLSAFATKLFFNNPFCHPKHVYECLKSINERYCEDPEPVNNPKPDDREIRNIVMYYYELFITNELDFHKQLRKKKGEKKDEFKKKHVFSSRYCNDKDKRQKQLDGMKAFHDGNNNKKIDGYRKAAEVLQDGSEITVERIAKHLGVSTRTIKRWNNNKAEKTAEIQVIIGEYNKSIRTENRCDVNLATAKNPEEKPKHNIVNAEGNLCSDNGFEINYTQPQRKEEKPATITNDGHDDDFSEITFSDEDLIKTNKRFDEPKNIEPRQVFESMYEKILSQIHDDEKKQAYQRFELCYNNFSDEEKKILKMKDEEIEKNRLEEKKDLQHKLHWSAFPIIV